MRILNSIKVDVIINDLRRKLDLESCFVGNIYSEKSVVEIEEFVDAVACEIIVCGEVFTREARSKLDERIIIGIDECESLYSAADLLTHAAS